jgi:hypothetical protein
MELKEFLTDAEEWFRNHANNKDDEIMENLDSIANKNNESVVNTCMDAIYAPCEYWDDIENKLAELAKNEL